MRGAAGRGDAPVRGRAHAAAASLRRHPQRAHQLGEDPSPNPSPNPNPNPNSSPQPDPKPNRNPNPSPMPGPSPNPRPTLSRWRRCSTTTITCTLGRRTCRSASGAARTCTAPPPCAGTRRACSLSSCSATCSTPVTVRVRSSCGRWGRRANPNPNPSPNPNPNPKLWKVGPEGAGS